jgi:periplasmic copper chaperone A
MSIAREEKAMKPMLLVSTIALCLLATATLAQDYKIGALEVDHPWSRATPKGAKSGAGYLTIKNTGSSSDRLVGGTMADAGAVEIHEMSMAGGVMKMRPVHGGIEIKPGESVDLKPGGFHLMFLQLDHPLKQGERVRGTLNFEKAGTLDLEYTVEALGQSSMPGMKNMH